MVQWAEFQQRIATEQEIRLWWNKWPNANIGIVTGRISGIVVIDVDPKRGGNEYAAQLYQECPTGLISQTGSGGYHLFYRYPTSAITIPNRVDLWPGVDVRGDGGYVVVPPSLHASGNRYCWYNEDEPGELSDIAQYKMVHGISSLDDEEFDISRTNWLSQLFAGVNSGQRNDACARLAGYLASKDIPRDVAIQILHNWDRQNIPPLTQDEIAVTVESVYKTARRRNNSAPQRGVDQKISEKNLFKVVDLREYMLQYGDAEVSWVIQDWLPEDTIAFAIAPPGSYKTWMLLDVAVSVASGMPFLGQFPVLSTGPVLIVQQEDPHGSMAQRLGIIVDTRFQTSDESSDEFTVKMPPDLPIYVHPDRNLRFSDPNVMQALEDQIAKIKPKLVIIDPLYSAAATDDYMAKSAEQMLELKRFRDKYRCSFLIAHHTKKRAESANREEAWGSQFLNALLETGWQIRRSQTEEAVLVHRHFKAFQAGTDIKLQFNISTEPPYQFNIQVLNDININDTDTNARIIGVLNQSSEPMTIQSLADILGTHRSTISRRLKILERDDMVRKDKNGHYFLPKNLPSF